MGFVSIKEEVFWGGTIERLTGTGEWMAGIRLAL